MNLIKRPAKDTSLFIAVIALYLLLGFVLPIDAAAAHAFNYTNGQYRILSLLVKLPIAAVWGIAFWSYRRMWNYAESISDTPEGVDYTRLRSGLRWLAWGLPLPGLLSSILVPFFNHGTGYSAALIVTNYLYVIGSLVAFHYISSATHGLARRNDVRLSTRHIRILVSIFVGFSVILSFLTADKLHGNGAGDTINAFHLQNILVWLTILGPYLYAWFIGLFAAMEITLVARKTSGIIYRRALQLFTGGVLVIISSMIVLQYFRSIVPRNGHFILSGSLLTSYAIYAVYAIGWSILIAGTARLQRIEDV